MSNAITKEVYEMKCQCCGKKFYSESKRMYCSIECYEKANDTFQWEYNPFFDKSNPEFEYVRVPKSK